LKELKKGCELMNLWRVAVEISEVIIAMFILSAILFGVVNYVRKFLP